MKGPLVHCYDEEQKVVAKKFVNDCTGRVVSEQEASRIGSRQDDYVPRTPSRSYRLGAPVGQLVSTGTGIFVNWNGTVLTSEHVVNTCSHVSVSPAAGGSHFATVIATDRERDLALLAVPVAPKSIGRFAHDAGPAIANGVTIIGYPKGTSFPGTPVEAQALILGVKQAAPGLRVIGFAGNVQPGNSGGPLLDAFGMIVGVVFAKAEMLRGTSEETVGFAIPADSVALFLQRNGALVEEVGNVSPPLVSEEGSETEGFIARVGCWR